MPTKSRNRRRRRGNGRNKNTLRRAIDLPQLKSRPVTTHTIRYASDGAHTNVIVTEWNLLTCCGSVCTLANSTLRSLAASVKLHSLEVWGRGTDTGDPATISIDWTTDSPVGNYEGNVSDTSLTSAYPAHLFTKPPKGSSAEWWLSGADNDAVFTISSNTAIIIDVHYSVIHLDGAAGIATTTVGAASLGVVYYPPLDGFTDFFLPQGLTTTT